LAEPGLYAHDNATLVEKLVRTDARVAGKKVHLGQIVDTHFPNGIPAAPFTPAPPDRADPVGTRPGGGTVR